MASTPELTVGNTLTVYERRIEKKFYMMVLKLILKGTLKVYSGITD